MNIEKRMAYCNNETQIGIHTGNGTTQEIVDLDKAGNINLIENCHIRKVRNEDNHEIYMRINPNKNMRGYISTEYTEFQEKTKNLFNDLGISKFEWRRVDLSFNTLDQSHYFDYIKLNRLLIACFANSANDYNTYDTKNFWNGKTKSLVTKNGYREIEFYDKKDESNQKSPYFSRLELRSMRLRGDIEHEFLDVWFERLDKVAKEFANVQNRFNQCMSEIYLADIKKKKCDRDFLSVSSFLMTKRDYIFTNKQMKNLLMLIGLTEKEATYKAYNFKKYHNIEYFKKEDLDNIVTDIKTKIIDYFSK